MRFDGNVYYHECEPYPAGKMMEEWRDTAQLCDATGFTSIWLGEHHFWYSGYPVAAPNPVLVGLHLASVTERIWVAQSACILPDFHPIRLAEDLATVDQITKGRLDVGIARGTNSSASIQFNVHADRRDPKTNYRLFDETLEIMKKAWTQDAFSHEGEFYTFPVPGWPEGNPSIYQKDPEHYGPNGELRALGIMPRPYQKPHPPIWQAADSVGSYEYAARKGHSVIGFGASFESTRECWTLFRVVSSEVSGRDVPMGLCANGQTLNAMRIFHMAETREQAEVEAREGINTFFDLISGLNPNWARQAFLASHEELSDDDRNMDWLDFLQKYEIAWIGSPEDVAERIDKLRSELNCQHVTIWPNPGLIPYAKVRRGIELFAERVMPKFAPSRPRRPGLSNCGDPLQRRAG
jgi:alkanesulfonate monooxygenase SsuD/methylene tetrahydromethanopterin reductase-like flavin-dependent oxidoreductase (luciferase family)